MSKIPAQKIDDPDQYNRFLEAAEEVEADDDIQVFDRVFKRIAKERSRSTEKARKHI